MTAILNDKRKFEQIHIPNNKDILNIILSHEQKVSEFLKTIRGEKKTRMDLHGGITDEDYRKPMAALADQRLKRLHRIKSDYLNTAIAWTIIRSQVTFGIGFTLRVQLLKISKKYLLSSTFSSLDTRLLVSTTTLTHQLSLNINLI